MLIKKLSGLQNEMRYHPVQGENNFHIIVACTFEDIEDDPLVQILFFVILISTIWLVDIFVLKESGFHSSPDTEKNFASKLKCQIISFELKMWSSSAILLF